MNVYNGNRDNDAKGRRNVIDFDSCILRTCNLTIEPVQLVDAGYYTCFEASSMTARIAASLVVLGQLYVISS